MDSQLALFLDATRPALPLDQLSEEERAVVGALEWGRERAIQVPDLAKRVGIPQRRVQKILNDVVHQHGIPIGTSMSAPHGNYLIDDSEGDGRAAPRPRAQQPETLRGTDEDRLQALPGGDPDGTAVG